MWTVIFHSPLIGFVLRQMFPKLRHYQTVYMCTNESFGLSICFKKSLIDKILQYSDGYVLMFDEILNIELQMKQMDLLIRLWEGMKYIQGTLIASSWGMQQQ